MIDFNIDNYLRISWQDILLVCISTFIIVVVCKHFFWNKLLAFIEKRQAVIQNNIDESTKLKNEAMAEKAQYEEKMRGAGAEAAQIIDNAKKEANVEKDQIIASAKTQAASIERAAQEDIERDKLKAQNEMKAAITDVALAAAGQILGAEMDEQKQKQVVDQFLNEAGDDAW